MIRQTKLIMGMPITLELDTDNPDVCEQLFDYFMEIDERYSTYKATSEVSRLNTGQLTMKELSQEVQHILALCEETNRESNGYFDIHHNGIIDPSGLVKGWAIERAAEQVRRARIMNFCISAGGDIALGGTNEDRQAWRIGIRNPFNTAQIVKTLSLTDCGVATSGSYIRGQHVYDPYQPDKPLEEVCSLTVIGPNIYEADRFATAAFAMGSEGISFIEQRPGLEGYMINTKGIATYTSGFERYITQ
jgi:thiamine biosynthesis lipoprotein